MTGSGDAVFRMATSDWLGDATVECTVGAVLFDRFGSFVVGPIDAALLAVVPGAVPATTVITNVNIAEVLAAIEAGPLHVNWPPEGALHVQPVGKGVVDVTVRHADVPPGGEGRVHENVSVRTGLVTAAGPLFVTTTV